MGPKGLPRKTNAKRILVIEELEIENGTVVSLVRNPDSQF